MIIVIPATEEFIEIIRRYGESIEDMTEATRLWKEQYEMNGEA